LKQLVFTVTNELNFDQRMLRICNSLSQNGYDVTLIGRCYKNSPTIIPQNFKQKRIHCLFKKGPGFYAEYNIRLFFLLLFYKADLFCAIDLDTIMPVYFAGKIKNKILVYDAHEYFTQQKEIITRKFIYTIWLTIERFFLPKFNHGYTVGAQIALEFKKLYNVDYDIIMNTPLLTKKTTEISHPQRNIILYQGAVNEARGLEFLIPAFKNINGRLYIYGNGNLFNQIKKIIAENNLNEKVFLFNAIEPTHLKEITEKATIGINLVENNGLNQYYSLANKFFDYIHAELPQITMNFPEYKKINNQFEVAVLINNLEIEMIESAINTLMEDVQLYGRLKQNCILAKEKYCWQIEEIKLISFYKKIFG
jgi:glycosyltransferase involved in cell wall biosynthesis